MEITNGQGLHLNPTSPSNIPAPSHHTRKPPSHPHNPKRKPPPSSSWADQVDECRPTTANKKQRLAQIMNWQTAKPASKPILMPKPNPSKQYEHKDGDKLLGGEKTSSVREGSTDTCMRLDTPCATLSCDTQQRDVQCAALSCDAQLCDAHSCDAHSCDSHSTCTSDAMSCDTLSSCDSVFGEHDGEELKKRRKNKKKNKKRNQSAAEEGKKIFVGKIKFEKCDAMLSNSNETLETLRHSTFVQMFYLFGAVNRVQGHWDKGYCFVVFTTRRAAKLAIRCLSFAQVRQRVVQNLQTGRAPTGVLPLPSFYVRWATVPPRNTPTSSPLSSSPLTSSPISISPLSTSPFSISPFSTSPSPSSLPSTPSSSQTSDEEKEEIEWIKGMKEEDMGETEVERLMQELLKLRD